MWYLGILLTPRSVSISSTTIAGSAWRVCYMDQSKCNIYILEGEGTMGREERGRSGEEGRGG